MCYYMIILIHLYIIYRCEKYCIDQECWRCHSFECSLNMKAYYCYKSNHACSLDDNSCYKCGINSMDINSCNSCYNNCFNKSCWNDCYNTDIFTLNSLTASKGFDISITNQYPISGPGIFGIALVLIMISFVCGCCCNYIISTKKDALSLCICCAKWFDSICEDNTNSNSNIVDQNRIKTSMMSPASHLMMERIISDTNSLDNINTRHYKKMGNQRIAHITVQNPHKNLMENNNNKSISKVRIKSKKMNKINPNHKLIKQSKNKFIDINKKYQYNTPAIIEDSHSETNNDSNDEVGYENTDLMEELGSDSDYQSTNNSSVNKENFKKIPNKRGFNYYRNNVYNKYRNRFRFTDNNINRQKSNESTPSISGFAPKKIVIVRQNKYNNNTHNKTRLMKSKYKGYGTQSTFNNI